MVIFSYLIFIYSHWPNILLTLLLSISSVGWEFVLSAFLTASCTMSIKACLLIWRMKGHSGDQRACSNQGLSHGPHSTRTKNSEQSCYVKFMHPNFTYRNTTSTASAARRSVFVAWQDGTSWELNASKSITCSKNINLFYYLKIIAQIPHPILSSS